MTSTGATSISLTVDGQSIEVPDSTATLLDTLRELGHTSVKDGCSPQGQCGCCTVLVDGQPRVACVTPTRRVRDRAITTPAGLEATPEWADALCATGGSQCGFCTPGIIVRLEGLRTKKPDADRSDVQQALAAHLCRCTGWNTIVDAWDYLTNNPGDTNAARDWDAASERAEIEGHNPQQISPDIAAGSAVFASDTAPADALVALLRDDDVWVVGQTIAHARELAGKIQGRRTTLEPHYPIAVPDPTAAEGPWVATLQTTWVEPAYLETDASWCEPGGEPASALANGGAFGAKAATDIGAVARRLADEYGRAVLVLYSREDSARLGPKRPPLAGGVRADGSGEVVVARTPGIAAAIAAANPNLHVTEVDIPGPPTSAALRGAGWAEAIALSAAAAGKVGRVTTPDGGWAEATVTDDVINIEVYAGDPLDEIMLRSYCIGAAHMAASWVRSEAMAIDPDGVVHDLTVRSFGVVRALDMPDVNVTFVPSTEPAVNCSDAVFAAVAAASWLHADLPAQWPVGQPSK